MKRTVENAGKIDRLAFHIESGEVSFKFQFEFPVPDRIRHFLRRHQPQLIIVAVRVYEVSGHYRAKLPADGQCAETVRDRHLLRRGVEHILFPYLIGHCDRFAVNGDGHTGFIRQIERAEKQLTRHRFLPGLQLHRPGEAVASRSGDGFPQPEAVEFPFQLENSGLPVRKSEGNPYFPLIGRLPVRRCESGHGKFIPGVDHQTSPVFHIQKCRKIGCADHSRQCHPSKQQFAFVEQSH